MTNEQILKRAIEKAVEGGFKPHIDLEPYTYFEYVDGFLACFKKASPKQTCIETHYVQIHTIIFSHSFAKAFWGEYYICSCGQKLKDDDGKIHKTFKITLKCPNETHRRNYIWKQDIAWKYHLTEMVLEEEPLKYLEGFL